MATRKEEEQPLPLIRLQEEMLRRPEDKNYSFERFRPLVKEQALPLSADQKEMTRKPEDKSYGFGHLRSAKKNNKLFL